MGAPLGLSEDPDFGNGNAAPERWANVRHASKERDQRSGSESIR
ncbi:MAG: hypothetical protein AAF488_03860 [Planctomycetota bacterium]